MGSSKNKKNEMKNKQNKSKEDISFKDDKDGLHIHITIYNFYNNTNQGGNVETKSYTSEGGQNLTGKDGEIAGQGWQIAEKGGQNANQFGQIAKEGGENKIKDAENEPGASE